MDINARINAIAERRHAELVAIRRTLHQHPELAFEEHETARTVTTFLQALGIDCRTNVGGTGVVAVIDGTKAGRTIGVRADMDALPIHEETGLSFASKIAGKSHACGHDVHTVIALGVAAALCEMRDALAGRVKLIFQPAEETLSGAAAMILDGALDDPKLDAIVGYHNWPAIEAGNVGYHADAVMASADAFDVALTGRAGHGAHPHLAIDALAAGAYFVTQLQSIVSREIAPLSPAVVTIGEFHSGTARNVIAPTAVLKGSARTTDAQTASLIEAAVRRLLEGMRIGMRVDYTLDWTRVAPALRQHPATLQSVLASARSMLDEAGIVEMPQPSMGSEDFAWFAERVPAAHLRIGSKIDGLDTAIHRSNYDCNELAITTGVRVVTRALLDLTAGR
ncbi:MAG TPA: M20 family metallopeptidase [Casimicrobiaceae bacterium]|nr:M20 family metallopeptidase [Casimicrobiaceae bacterium]